MRMVITLTAAALLVATAGAAVAQPAASPLGTWLADDGKSRVQISPCGDQLCGTVTWLKNPLDDAGKPQVDKNNPDPALRGRAIVGLQILQGLVKDDSGPDQWEGGSIYDPESGKTYSCTIALQDANTLRVHGYVGVAMFGRTQVWTRVT